MRSYTLVPGTGGTKGTMMRKMLERTNKTTTSLGAWNGGFQLQLRKVLVCNRSSPTDTSVLMTAEE
jgi:hypothetical protein